MFDEMTCAFDSPGSVSKVFIVNFLSRDSKKMRGAEQGPKEDGDVPRVLGSQLPAEVGCGVRLR